MEDKILAARAAHGDQDAFRILVERYRSYIYTIAYKIALQEEDAMDITQNVLIRLVDKIGTFNGTGTFRGWLATIASREAFNHLRRPGRRETSTEPGVLETLPNSRQDGTSLDPRKRLDTQQQRELVESAMKSLSPQQRAIFTLRLKEEMGPKQIAEVLGLPPRQVRVQLHRAIGRIRRLLAKEE